MRVCDFIINRPAALARVRAGETQRSSPRRAAFTVIELMLAIAIMGVIIYALYSVFNQTQRAMRATETQTDVSEKARAIVEMMTRELEQAQPTFRALRIGTNAFVEEVNLAGGMEYPPRVQKPDRPDITPRTNFISNIFFYNRHTNAWIGIGYRVSDYHNGVGSLERFETNIFGYRPLSNYLYNGFISLELTNANYHHVADGVVHLAFIPYDENGYRLGFDTTNRNPSVYNILRQDISGRTITAHSDVPTTNNATVRLSQGFIGAPPAYQTLFSFKSNALPAYIDLEFGILEPETLTQYYQMLKDENPNATNFLARQITKVHLFRQRIPIRTAAQ
jgi:prepilin-type N-terminal cleavage/methylation domain-containing protein